MTDRERLTKLLKAEGYLKRTTQGYTPTGVWWRQGMPLLWEVRQDLDDERGAQLAVAHGILKETDHGYDPNARRWKEAMAIIDSVEASLTKPDGDDSIVLPKGDWRRKRVLLRATRYFHYRLKIKYSQSRPTQLRLPRETTRLDCSGLVAACMDFAEVMPRVDWRYTNTWVQINLGRNVASLANAKPGDVVFYGTARTNPTHEALMLGTLRQLREEITVPAEVAAKMTGSGPYVLSNGHYPMNIYPVDYRRDRVAIRDFIL